VTASWTTALVSGASSGIGQEIARQLAAGGTDIVAVARDETRLKTLAREVANVHPGVDVEVLPADLADPDQLAAVESRLSDDARPIDLLVNNAGFGTYGRFASLDRDNEELEIRVNVIALVRMTHAALGPMLARDRGAIMNISSIAGLQATPGNATYGATKSFVASFSEAVHGELAGTGVTITAVLPGFTRTEFHQRAGIAGRNIPSFAWQSAEACAAEALAGTRSGRAWVVPGTLNRVVAAASGVAPRGLTRRIAARVSSRL
jgi:uncharacterized protein